MTFNAWVAKWINQIAHVGWGAFLTVGLASHVRIWIAVLAVAVFAGLKEGVFDRLTEDKSQPHNDGLDFVFWLAGIGLGVLAWL